MALDLTKMVNAVQADLEERNNQRAEHEKRISELYRQQGFSKLDIALRNIDELLTKIDIMTEIQESYATGVQSGMNLKEPDFKGFSVNEGAIEYEGNSVYPISIDFEDKTEAVRFVNTYRNSVPQESINDVMLTQNGLAFTKDFDSFEFIKDESPNIAVAIGEQIYEQSLKAKELARELSAINKYFKKEFSNSMKEQATIDKAAAKAMAKEEKAMAKEAKLFEREANKGAFVRNIKETAAEVAEQARNSLDVTKYNFAKNAVKAKEVFEDGVDFVTNNIKNIVIDLGNGAKTRFLELVDFVDSKENQAQVYNDLSRWDKQIQRMQSLYEAGYLDKYPEASDALQQMHEKVSEAKSIVETNSWTRQIYDKVNVLVQSARSLWDKYVSPVIQNVTDKLLGVEEELVQPISVLVKEYSKTHHPKLYESVKNLVSKSVEAVSAAKETVANIILPPVIDPVTHEVVSKAQREAVALVSTLDDLQFKVENSVTKAYDISRGIKDADAETMYISNMIQLEGSQLRDLVTTREDSLITSAYMMVDSSNKETYFKVAYNINELPSNLASVADHMANQNVLPSLFMERAVAEGLADITPMTEKETKAYCKKARTEIKSDVGNGDRKIELSELGRRFVEQDERSEPMSYKNNEGFIY